MYLKKFNKQWIFLSILLVILFSLVLYYQENLNKLEYERFKNIYYYKRRKNYTSITGQTPKNSIQCYRAAGKTLPDISEISIRKGKSIFFHETSCTSYDREKISISSRQACAVESAAKMNPNLDIFLLYSSPGEFQFDGDESDQFLKALLSYKNVRIMHLDYKKYTEGTPVETLYNSGKIENSSYVVSHASDVLRFLTLWKYGGIYLDLDTIVLKSLEEIPLNFGGVESDYEVGSAILSFDAVETGHLLAKSCLLDLKDGFNGQAWINNGPGVIKRLLQSVCEVKDAKDMIGKKCNGFTVYPMKTFFPLPYPQWNKYFDNNWLPEILNVTKDSYILHIWNKLSAQKVLPLSSNAPYLYFARKYCPKVVEACTNYF